MYLCNVFNLILSFDCDVVKKDFLSVNLCEIEFETHNEMFDKKA